MLEVEFNQFNYETANFLTVIGIPNFDKTRYLGSWYEYANVFEFYQIGSRCVRATYTDEGKRIGVFNEQVNSMYDCLSSSKLLFVITLITYQNRKLWQCEG